VRFSTKFAGAVLGLAAAGLLAAPVPAQAAPAVNADEVVKALGLASEPADYVVLVDTSGSMNQGGRYPAVRSQLRQLLTGLDSDDRLSLVTFDASADRRYRGVVGTNPDAILAHLPATAAGVHTDIGAAIDSGLVELERPDTHRLIALILITDGELDTVPEAKYAKVGSAAWKKLKTRAAALAGDHEVAAYAVSLLATTDAALLKKVFPKADEVGAADVGARFGEVSGDLVRLQAAKALRDELASPITVTWAGDLGTALADGKKVPLQLTITSPYPHVPVTLTQLSVQAPEGLTIAVTGLPDKVSLEPGGTTTLTLEATVAGSAGSNAGVSLKAVVASPWSKVLEGDLGLQFAPAIEGTAAVPPAPIKLPPNLLPTVGAIAAVVGLGVLVLFLGRLLLTPRMSGLLVIARDGRVIGEVVVAGRRSKLVAPAGVKELSGLAGGLVGAWGPAKGQRAVRVTARFGEARARGLLGEGDVIQLGEMEIGYVSDRRRILDKIGLPTAGTTATN
jgi:hypothetical protein